MKFSCPCIGNIQEWLWLEHSGGNKTEASTMHQSEKNMNDTWTERWNDRYSKDEFAYGEQPNNYLKEQLEKSSRPCA